MPLQALCLGHRLDLSRPQSGVVHSVFEHALNLLIDGELWTVHDASRSDGPFGIRLAPGGRRFPARVCPGASVQVRAGYVGVGPLVLDGRIAARWTPRPWARPATGLESRLAFLEQRARPRAWAESANLAAELTAALRISQMGLNGPLFESVRRSVGRGPGLTPSGDDVLVGMLTVLVAETPGSSISSVHRPLVTALATALASTVEVSRHLLNQAARGLPGRALHELGRAVMEGAPDQPLTEALDRVLDIGATSGADACLGLVAACRFSFLIPEKAAA